MMRLSHLPAESAMQRQMLALVGWLIVAVLVVGAFAIVHTASGGSYDDPPAGLLPVRAVLGAVLALLSLRLPVLLRRHAPAIAEVAGLKRQYVAAAAVTAVLGAIWIFFWWTGLVATVVGLVALVASARIRTAPTAEMTERVDYLDPDAWRPTGPLADRPVLRFVLALGVGLVLGVVLITVVILLGT